MVRLWGKSGVRRSLTRQIKTRLLVVVMLAVQPLNVRSQQASFARLPEDKAGPQLFGAGVISTGDDEVGGVFSPDGHEFYFAKLNPTTTFARIGILCVSHWRDGQWSAPEVLPFSGKYLDFPPRLSPDGTAMYFASTRPSSHSRTRVMRIWKSKKAGEGWGEPQPLGEPVNLDDGWNWGPSVTNDGTIYFTSDRGEPGHLQIYRAALKDGVYQQPEKLGLQINSEFNDYDAFVNADETILFFVSQGEGGPPFRHRADTLYGQGFLYARGDIYFSRRVNGEWTPAKHLEHGVNTVADEGYPALTPDEKHLIFTSERSPLTLNLDHRLTMAELEKYLHGTLNGHGNVYTVPVKALGLGDDK
jgi:hypothetical protein